MEKKFFSDEIILELAINAGAKDCNSRGVFHEVLTEREDFYRIKSEIEKKAETFIYSGIEWRPKTYLNINKAQSDSVVKMLEALDENDDVQNIFINCNINYN